MISLLNFVFISYAVQGVLPLAKKLGEKVLESCATKLRPYLLQAVKTLGISLNDYSKVLTTICQETPGSMEQNDVCAGENVVSFLLVPMQINILLALNTSHDRKGSFWFNCFPFFRRMRSNQPKNRWMSQLRYFIFLFWILSLCTRCTLYEGIHFI